MKNNMDIDLTPKLKLKMCSRPRVRGRYNSSELYFINNGMVTPEEWLNPPEKDVKSILNMWGGIAIHTQLEDLMGAQYSEEKRVHQYKDITLVGKSDFLPPHKLDEVWEFKTSKWAMNNSKPWHEHQVKLYTTMFEKKYGVVYQPVQNDQGLFLKHLGTFNRDDKWFQEELEKLYVFHERVEKLRLD